MRETAPPRDRTWENRPSAWSGESHFGSFSLTGPAAETLTRAILAGVVLCVALIAAVVLLANRGLALPGQLIGSPPPYQTETITVPPGQFSTVTLDGVRAGQTLEGYFVAHGGNDDVGFQIQSPSGGYLVRIGRVSGRDDFHYRAPADGPYVLVFDNSFSIITSKTVTVEYRAY
jgi:hypothetical protein